MKYKASFIGRERGAIGIFYRITDTVEAENETQAFEKICEKWELQGDFKLIPLTDK
mgnify:CR=1 FL=1